MKATKIKLPCLENTCIKHDFQSVYIWLLNVIQWDLALYFK